RMVARPSNSDYGRLSVMLQYRFIMEKLIDVPAEAFRPPPKVDSAIVRMTPRSQDELLDVDEQRLSAVVTEAFTKRRKTLRNALASSIDAAGLQALGIDPGLRPENLGVAEFVLIANAIAARAKD